MWVRLLVLRWSGRRSNVAEVFMLYTMHKLSDISQIREVKKRKQIALDFEIDRLTNSIQNTISGDSFQTEVSLLTVKDFCPNGQCH